MGLWGWIVAAYLYAAGCSIVHGVLQEMRMPQRARETHLLFTYGWPIVPLLALAMWLHERWELGRVDR